MTHQPITIYWFYYFR